MQTASLGTDTEQRQFMQNLTRVRTNVRNAKKCEKVCPQSIKISHTMTEIAKNICEIIIKAV